VDNKTNEYKDSYKGKPEFYSVTQGKGGQPAGLKKILDTQVFWAVCAILKPCKVTKQYLKDEFLKPSWPTLVVINVF